MSNCGCKNNTTSSSTTTTCTNTGETINIVTTPELNPAYDSSVVYNSYNCNTCGCITSACTCQSVASPCGTMSHLQPIVQQLFSPFLKSEGRSLFPEVGGTNLLKFPYVDKLLADSILFNGEIGYIEIVSWDGTNKLATFRNNEDFVGSQVLQSGEYIPDCTDWIITAPVAGVGSSTDTSGACYLAKDYVVPELGSSSVAVFTSTDCFAAGDFIRIDGTALKVLSVISSTQATLSNENSGVDALKEITADECGNLLHKVVLIGEESPCENAVTVLDAVQGISDLETCQKGIIVPTAENQVLVSNSQNQFVLGVLPDLDPETTFQGCVTLNPALDPQEYPLTLDDESEFSIDDIVFFDCDAADPPREFLIKDLVGALATLEPLFEVTAIELISVECEGCKLVSAGCCRAIEERLITTIEPLDACPDETADPGTPELLGGGIGEDYAIKSLSIDREILKINGAPEHTSAAAGSVDSTGAFVLTNVNDSATILITRTVVNTSLCREMEGLASITAAALGVVSGGNVSLKIDQLYDSGDGVLDAGTEHNSVFVSEAGVSQSLLQTVARTFMADANATTTIRAQVTVTKLTATGVFTASNFSGSLRFLASTI